MGDGCNNPEQTDVEKIFFNEVSDEQLDNASLRRRETRFCGAETKAPKPSLQFNLQIAETKCAYQSLPVRAYSH